jgi:ribosome-associated toxin RatA of RatAB toxin-antitoxin module
VPDQSTQSIDIDAAPAAVMAVIADFEHYPTWAGSVKRAEVVEQGPDGRAVRVKFSVDAGLIRDRYELSYVWDGDRQVEWNLVQGQMMRAQQGRYLLEPTAAGTGTGTGTHVTYWLSVDLAIPMLGQLKRKAERMVMDQALRELKKRVEAVA